jgi:hypothetical protein
MTTESINRLEELIEYDRPDMPVCNCGSCKKLLVSEDAKKKYGAAARNLDTVFLRARGVPFCRGCASDGEVRFVIDARERGVA